VRTPIRILTFLGILTMSVPAAATAEWHLTPFLGLTFQGDTSIFDPRKAAGNAHWTFGGSVTFIGGGPVGVEGLLVYAPGFFEGEPPPGINDPPNIIDSRSLALMGNVVLATPRKWTEYGLRPFVSGGIGLLHTSATDELGLVPVRTNLLGYNVGGGAVGFLTARTGLRFDLRYFGTLKKINDPPIAIFPVYLSYWTGTVGVVFRY